MGNGRLAQSLQSGGKSVSQEGCTHLASAPPPVAGSGAGPPSILSCGLWAPVCGLTAGWTLTRRGPLPSRPAWRCHGAARML